MRLLCFFLPPATPGFKLDLPPLHTQHTLCRTTNPTQSRTHFFLFQTSCLAGRERRGLQACRSQKIELNLPLLRFDVRIVSRKRNIHFIVDLALWFCLNVEFCQKKKKMLTGGGLLVLQYQHHTTGCFKEFTAYFTVKKKLIHFKEFAGSCGARKKKNEFYYTLIL